ncbi:trypsin-like peptidase domain-containing protein [Thermogymnomonas acidicola]|uniref:S1C family serine protease n=1 Tax=Thermogymnomonas acidicola TaxID=399579 RepID=UPI001396C02A|nr:trypsin-like peptidase domain-containing protein [Thermogymnomonas acidicola]
MAQTRPRTWQSYLCLLWACPLPGWGDSEKLKIGQFAIAIGNALGLPGGHTVSLGVISAVNRPMPWATHIAEGLIQTDAAINPGNSGGPPLVNTSGGEVIGINTAIIPFAQGMGFSIPVNTARNVVEQILLHGRVIRPWIGISGVDINDGIARRYRLQVDRGVFVVETSQDGPAYRSGVRPGDVIVSMDGEQVSTMRDVVRVLNSRGINAIVTLDLIRGYRQLRLSLRIAEMPELRVER